MNRTRAARPGPSRAIAPLAAVVSASIAVATPAAADTVSVAGFGGGDTVVLNGLIDEAMAEEIAAAGIEVEYTPIDGDFSQFLLNALSAGTAPDLYYVDIFWSDAVFGTGRADPVRDQSVAGELLPGLAEAFTRDGTLMGIPKDFNSLVLNYNVDVFEDAGVEPPDADDTWSDFEDKLAAVADELGDIAGICLVPDYARFGPFALATGWQPFDADGRTVLDEDFRRAFAFYTGLADSGAGTVAADLGEGWMGGCMSSEKAAVALEGAWMIAHLRDAAPSMVWDATRMPIDPETGHRGNLIFTVAWVVNPESQVRDSAHALAEILTSEPAQQWVLEEGLAIPSRAALDDNPWLDGEDVAQVASRHAFEGTRDEAVTPYYFGEYGGAWMEPINSALNAVLLDELDVEAALEEAQEKLDRLTGHDG